MQKDIGDDRPLITNGYRFYTTFNKGFSPILTWMPDGGKPITGTVNMPSYPLFSFSQENTWTPPNGKKIKFWLRLKTGMKVKQDWVLDGDNATGNLVVNTGGKRVELNPGEQIRLDGGVLRYEDLTTWMGFKIFYDPTLKPLFITAIISVLGMAAHFKQKFDAMSRHINVPEQGAHQGAPATEKSREGGQYEHNTLHPAGGALAVGGPRGVCHCDLYRVSRDPHDGQYRRGGGEPLL